MSAKVQGQLMACRECDALQRESLQEHHSASACWRCGAFLEHKQEGRPDRALMLALSGLVLFLVANAFPLIVLDMHGASTGTTLVKAAGALWSEGMEPVASLVFLTTVLAPVFSLLAMAYLYGGLTLCEQGLLEKIPPYTAALLHIVQWLRHWSMLEVFFLAAFVSVVRLSDIAQVRTGVALWACGGLILVFAALMGSFHPRDLWVRVEQYGGGP